MLSSGRADAVRLEEVSETVHCGQLEVHNSYTNNSALETTRRRFSTTIGGSLVRLLPLAPARDITLSEIIADGSWTEPM